jgi:hypothetical protein
MTEATLDQTRALSYYSLFSNQDTKRKYWAFCDSNAGSLASIRLVCYGHKTRWELSQPFTLYHQHH